MRKTFFGDVPGPAANRGDRIPGELASPLQVQKPGISDVRI